MLGNNTYYNEHLKKYVSAFGTIFNDISIIRKSKNNDETLIKVPLSFVNKLKALNKLKQDPDLKATWYSYFPRMSFEMTSFEYDGERKENQMAFSIQRQNGTIARQQFSPVPYNIGFTLSIFSEYIEDGMQVVEQILPFFQPEFTLKVIQIPSLGIERDIPIVLNSVSFSDDVEGDYDSGRLNTWELQFTLKGVLYGPSTDKGIITTIDVNTIFDPSNKPSANYHAVGIPPSGPITEQLSEDD